VSFASIGSNGGGAAVASFVGGVGLLSLGAVVLVIDIVIVTDWVIMIH